MKMTMIDQIHVASGIADCTFGYASNHVSCSTNLADGERQTNLQHPVLQGFETCFGNLFVSHAVTLDIPHVLGKANKLIAAGKGF